MSILNTCRSTIELQERDTATRPGADTLTIVCDARVTPETVLAVLAEYDALDSTVAAPAQDALECDAECAASPPAEDAESVAAALVSLAQPVAG